MKILNAKSRRAFSIRIAIPLPIEPPISSVAAQGWENVPKMIFESEKQSWATVAWGPRGLTMASGVSAHGDGETEGDM